MTKTSVHHTNRWDIQTAQALNHIWIKEKAPHSSKEPLNTTSVSWYKHRKVFFGGRGVRRLVSFLLTENGLVSHTWWRMRFEKYPFGCRKFKGIPLKTNMSPETNGWFRCILYWHSTFFSGTFVSFRGIFSCRCSSVWKANSSTKRSTTSKVSNLRNFRSTNVFKCLGEMQGFWCHNRLALKQGGYDWIHNTKVTPYNLGGWEILGSRWGLTFSFTDVFECLTGCKVDGTVTVPTYWFIRTLY